MADISKCSNAENCSKKDSCYRHTAPTNPHWQPYSAFYKPEEKECPYYMGKFRWGECPKCGSDFFKVIDEYEEVSNYGKENESKIIVIVWACEDCEYDMEEIY